MTQFRKIFTETAERAPYLFSLFYKSKTKFFYIGSESYKQLAYLCIFQSILYQWKNYEFYDYVVYVLGLITWKVK